MRRRYPLLAAAVASLALAASAWAAPLDVPTATFVEVSDAKFVLQVTAGPSGLPNGFAVYWMSEYDYDDYGSVWPDQLTYPGLHWAQFTGTPTLNTFETYSTFILGPNESIMIELGDIEDETGVTTNTPEEIDAEAPYAACVFALGGTGGGRSPYTPTDLFKSQPHRECRFSQGYWKNHSSAWPVTSLKLGNVTYTKAQLLQILNKPANGNGLISLSKQLIATKLNLLLGSDPTPVAAKVAAADAQIGNLVVPPIGSGYLTPSSTSSKTQYLDDYNNGKYGSSHCNPPTPTISTTWGRIKSLYR